MRFGFGAKVVAGLACGVLAYTARESGSGRDASVLMWVAVTLAAGFFYSVVEQLWTRSVAPTHRNATQASPDLLASLIICSCSLAAASWDSSVLIPFIVRECAATGGQASATVVVVYFLWGAVGFFSPFAAAFSARDIAAGVHRTLDRRASERPIYKLLRSLAGFGAFTLACLLAIQSFKTALTSTSQGWVCSM